MGKWKRPESVPFPSIWRTFEINGADGVVRKYWIQDLTPEYEDIFLDNMIKVFVYDEPLCKYSKLAEHPQGMQYFCDLWRHGFTHKLGLICLTKDENDKIEFVGGNLTTVTQKDDKYDSEGNSESYPKFILALSHWMKQKDIFSELNINEYLSAYGLYVMPKFRGQGICTELLKARRELCLAVGLKASATIFTSSISQRSASKAGFKDFSEIDYDELGKINPKWRFPGITSSTKSAKNMYIQYT